jgi:type II secretory pathway pseudopilin PulG
MSPPRRSRRRVLGGRAFTIVEVLATLMLAAIVLPAVMHGVLLCLATADHATHQARAASLAQSKLAELVATKELYDAEMAGDFGEDVPEYTWTAQVNEWEDSRLVQVDVAVMWTSRGQERHVSLSTLVYMGSPNE